MLAVLGLILQNSLSPADLPQPPLGPGRIWTIINAYLCVFITAATGHGVEEWLSGYRHRVFILTRARSPSRQAVPRRESRCCVSQHVEEATSLGTDRPDI